MTRDPLDLLAGLEGAGVRVRWDDLAGRPLCDLNDLLALPDDHPAWELATEVHRRALDLAPFFAWCGRCESQHGRKRRAALAFPVADLGHFMLCQECVAVAVDLFDQRHAGWAARLVPDDVSALA